jgi:hypothetical protein
MEVPVFQRTASYRLRGFQPDESSFFCYDAGSFPIFDIPHLSRPQSIPVEHLAAGDPPFQVLQRPAAESHE